MKRILIFTLLACVASFYGCNKLTSITKSNQKVIVGKWVPKTERDLAYTTSGTLVLDTTYSITTADTADYYDIYNSNSTAYTISVRSGDTTGRFTYSINADQLMLYPNGNTSNPIYFEILNLSSSSMALQSQFQAMPAPGSSLNINTTYNFTSDVYFTR